MKTVDKSDSPADAPPAARRVVLVVDHFYPLVGGAETLFDELARGLVKAGERVLVVTQRVPRASAGREVRDGVELHRLWVPPLIGRVWFILIATPSIVRLARGAAMIHAGGYASMFPARLAARWLGVPVVSTVYEVLAEQLVTLARLPPLVAWCYRIFERFVMRLQFDRFLCISRYTADRLGRIAHVEPTRIVVVYPAVDYEFWKPGRYAARPLRDELQLAPPTRMCLFFGRPGISKGIETIVAAARRLNDDPARPCHLLMLLAHEPAAGREQVLRTIRVERLERFVTVLDPVSRSELPSYLLAADCVVIPSLSEGFGYSAVEAATLGCPIVGTSGHVFEEVLGDLARLVPPGDPESLANAMRDVAWRSTVERRYLPPRYDIATHVASVRQVYEQVLAERASSDSSSMSG